MRYYGDNSKPYDILIFYLPGSIDTSYENFFTHKIKIDEKQFDAIQKLVEFRDMELQDTANFGTSIYQFEIIWNKEISVFSTPYLERIEKIFYGIVNQFEGSAEQLKITTLLGRTITNLKFDNSIELGL